MVRTGLGQKKFQRTYAPWVTNFQVFAFDGNVFILLMFPVHYLVENVYITLRNRRTE